VAHSARRMGKGADGRRAASDRRLEYGRLRRACGDAAAAAASSRVGRYRSPVASGRETGLTTLAAEINGQTVGRAAPDRTNDINTDTHRITASRHYSVPSRALPQSTTVSGRQVGPTAPFCSA